MYSERGWVNDVLTRILVSMASRPDVINTFEIAEILSISEKLIIDLRKIDPVGGVLKTNFDFSAWRDDKFHKPIHEFVSKNSRVTLGMTKSQEEKLTSFAKANTHLEDQEYYFVAVESIFPRSDLFYGMKSSVPAKVL